LPSISRLSHSLWLMGRCSPPFHRSWVSKCTDRWTGPLPQCIVTSVTHLRRYLHRLLLINRPRKDARL